MRKFLLFLLLIFVLSAFAYARREIFFQQAKSLLEQKLAKSLPCKLSIGKIRAGLLYGLILENLKVSFPQYSVACNIEIDQARVNYNLWQANMGKLASRDLIFFLEGGRISFVDSYPLLKNLQGKVLLSQEGVIFEDIEATARDNPRNIVKFYGDISQNRLSLTVNLEHLKFGNFDVLTNLALTLVKKTGLQSKAQKFSGMLKTYGSVLNNRPFPEVSAYFEAGDEKLRILSFSLGDSYDLRGVVNLSSPFEADLSLNFYEAAMDELIARLQPSEEPDFSGLLNGWIRITGELARPKVEGYLEAKDGHLGDLNFVSADIHLKGRYPTILIADSRICREEDYFIMEGEMDFTNLENRNFMDLRFSADKGMLWQGWDITRSAEDRVHMSKSIADDFRVTFDTFTQPLGAGAGYMEGDIQGFADPYTNELGLEYRVFGDKLLKLRLKKEEEILGVERRIKF